MPVPTNCNQCGGPCLTAEFAAYGGRCEDCYNRTAPTFGTRIPAARRYTDRRQNGKAATAAPRPHKLTRE